MKYSTVDDIARLLRGRLQIVIPEESEFDTNLFSADNAYAPTAGAQTIDLIFVEQVGRQEEARIDLYLSQLYRYPLTLSSDITIDILNNISSLYIASSLIAHAFQGQSPNIVASDVSSAATDYRRQADFLMSSILASSGIFFPTSIQSQQQSAGVKQQRPLRLPGEILLGQKEIGEIIDLNYTFEGKRKINPKNKYFGNKECGPCSGRRDGSAASSTPNNYCVYNNEYIDYEKFDW